VPLNEASEIYGGFKKKKLSVNIMTREVTLALASSGTFEKLWKVNISFVMPACLSVGPVE
jgi:hypothetical protein